MSGLPKGWADAPFAQVVESVPTSGHVVEANEYVADGYIPVLTQGTTDLDGFTDDPGRAFDSNQPLIVFGDHTRAVKIGNPPFAVGPNTKVLATGPGLLPTFLYYQLAGILPPSRGYGRHYQFLARSRVAIAPIAEQRRIVTAIEEQFARLDSATAALDRVDHDMKRMRASVLASAYKAAADEFGIVTLSRMLGDEALFVDGDWVESKDQDPAGDHRLTQLADIGVGVWRNRSSRFMNAEQFSRLDCKALVAGDVLVARMPEPLGRACIFPGDTMPCATVVDVAIIRPVRNKVDAVWLMWILNSPQVRSQVAALAKGTTRRRVSRSNLATVEIPNLEFNAQLEQIAVLTSHLETISRIEQMVGVARLRHTALRSSILNSAFSGALTSQNPSDEPASALLERVASERASFNGHSSTRAGKRRRSNRRSNT